MMAGFIFPYRAKLLQKQKVTPNVTRFQIQKPFGYRFCPGQAIDLSIAQKGYELEVAPFTLTNTNKDPYLELYIKISPRKDSLTHGLASLENSAVLQLTEPWDTFIYKGIGIFIASRWRFSGFFIPRFGMGKKVLVRDLHAITAFWISGLLLLVLAGAFPWTEIVGANFKTVQKLTQTGFPETWMGIGLSKPTTGREIPLDSIVSKARKLNLPGKVHIDFPYGSAGVYSVGNIYYPDLSLQQKFHYNPYTGNLVLHQKWEDVGILMRGRMWVMAFHQGQFGPWNWWLMLIVAFFLFLSSFAAIVSYFAKKPKNRWVIPHVPRGFQASFGVIVIIIFLGLMFPLFGLSAFLIFVYEKTKLGRAIAEKQ